MVQCVLLCAAAAAQLGRSEQRRHYHHIAAMRKFGICFGKLEFAGSVRVHVGRHAETARIMAAKTHPSGSHYSLTAVAQIGVGLVEPVFPRRIENIEVDGIFEGPGFVRNVRGNAEDLTGVHHDLLAVDRKL